MSPASSYENRKWYSGMFVQEDWWSVWLGMTFVCLGLFSVLGPDLVGWVAYPHAWTVGTPFEKMIAPLGKGYKSWGPWGSMIASYVFISIPVCLGAYCMHWDFKKFVGGWTCIFVITYVVWIIGHHASITATSREWSKYGLTFGLGLGGGGAYILALVVGLFIGNFMKSFAKYLSEAAKPEWFIKTAIVFLGVKVGYMALKAAGFVMELAVAGAAATIVAYLIFWPGTYFIARRFFHFGRKTSAVLASGISICGVSAAVATAGAVRSKPLVPIMVSALIVVYAVIELVVLPPLFSMTMSSEPIVAGAAMGMSVKTDGADGAAGAVLDELMRSAKMEKDGVTYEEGAITISAVMTKVWIDMFIGLWAFVLAMVWVYKIDTVPGEHVPASEVWHRFPKFVLGYFLAWGIYLAILFLTPHLADAAKVGAMPVEKGFRKFFFMLTFVSIGCITDFKRLAQSHFGKLIFVYFIALFVYIVPVAVIVAYVFHHGMMPPMAG
jgi:uncharacterized membrane protein YadS